MSWKADTVVEDPHGLLDFLDVFEIQWPAADPTDLAQVHSGSFILDAETKELDLEHFKLALRSLEEVVIMLQEFKERVGDLPVFPEPPPVSPVPMHPLSRNFAKVLRVLILDCPHC